MLESNGPVKKEPLSPGWRKFAKLVGFGVFCLMAFTIVIVYQAATTPDKVVTQQEWTNHEARIKAGLKTISEARGANEMYSVARSLSEKITFDNCSLDGCSAFRMLLKDIAAANEDGIVTPKETENIKADIAFVVSEMKNGRTKVKERTPANLKQE